ncbi:hypothetical protein EB796_005834 [Bugula neritina]|uniref:ADAMTS cysteine-rich domain-containing protein n=1 Tax=Bugula neritina TaxID=10212 RepID=A0A7J7KD42_BUGNE|nr:hypothetical protein EB796_005834 [Bugula neritina]
MISLLWHLRVALQTQPLEAILGNFRYVLDGNCLSNGGSYIASWSEDYTGYIGQTIPVDEQCRLVYGDNYHYATSFFSDVCYTLWCTEDDLSTTAKRAALPYTTCGNMKWCVEEECVEDPNAPALDENCPFGDSPGLIFSNSDLTCATAEAINCAQSSTVINTLPVRH